MDSGLSVGGYKFQILRNFILKFHEIKEILDRGSASKVSYADLVLEKNICTESVNFMTCSFYR